jgi:hypothetical protein
MIAPPHILYAEAVLSCGYLSVAARRRSARFCRVGVCVCMWHRSRKNGGGDVAREAR